MGFPSSSTSDNSWLRARKYGDPKDYIMKQIRQNAENMKHMAVMLHDDTVWIDVKDRELDHVKLIAEHARSRGYRLKTHVDCYKRISLWKR
jgi:hypothetical protein